MFCSRGTFLLILWEVSFSFETIALTYMNNKVLKKLWDWDSLEIWMMKTSAKNQPRIRPYAPKIEKEIERVSLYKDGAYN